MRGQKNILFQLGKEKKKKKLLPPFPHPISVTAMCYDLPYSLKGHLEEKENQKNLIFKMKRR